MDNQIIEQGQFSPEDFKSELSGAFAREAPEWAKKGVKALVKMNPDIPTVVKDLLGENPRGGMKEAIEAGLALEIDHKVSEKAHEQADSTLQVEKEGLTKEVSDFESKIKFQQEKVAGLKKDKEEKESNFNVAKAASNEHTKALSEFSEQAQKAFTHHQEGNQNGEVVAPQLETIVEERGRFLKKMVAKDISGGLITIYNQLFLDPEKKEVEGWRVSDDQKAKFMEKFITELGRGGGIDAAFERLLDQGDDYSTSKLRERLNSLDKYKYSDQESKSQAITNFKTLSVLNFLARADKKRSREVFSYMTVSASLNQAARAIYYEEHPEAKGLITKTEEAEKELNTVSQKLKEEEDTLQITSQQLVEKKKKLDNLLGDNFQREVDQLTLDLREEWLKKIDPVMKTFSRSPLIWPVRGSFIGQLVGQQWEEVNNLADSMKLREEVVVEALVGERGDEKLAIGKEGMLLKEMVAKGVKELMGNESSYFIDEVGKNLAAFGQALEKRDEVIVVKRVNGEGEFRSIEEIREEIRGKTGSEGVQVFSPYVFLVGRGMNAGFKYSFFCKSSLSDRDKLEQVVQRFPKGEKINPGLEEYVIVTYPKGGID